VPINLARDQILVERRYVAVFETLTDDVITALATALPEELRDALAKAIALPRGSFDDAASLAQRIRQGMVARKAIIDTGVVLSEPCTEWFVEILGDRADDPSYDDLQGLIPDAIDKFGLDAVRLMAVQYSVALGGFRRLVTEDERFAIPARTTFPPPVRTSAADQEAKRAARRARREQERKKRQQ
jgi:hypothetical protein